MSGHAQRVGAFILALILVLTSACSAFRTLTPKPVEYPATTKIMRKIQLHLAEDTTLRNAVWRTSTGHLIEIEMGDVLATRSEEVARSLFADVVVSNAATLMAGREFVLTPKVVLVEQSRPIFIFQDQHTTMALEWTLRDAGGSPVWIKTVTSHKQVPMGGMISAVSNSEALVQEVIDDLFRQSFEQMSLAREIRALARP